MLANAGIAVFGKGADLGDVSDIGADARAEQDSDAGVGGTVESDERGGWIEDSAAGKANDVVQKAQGAGDGAVLVVDVAIDVSAIGGGDDVGGRLVVNLAPAMNLNLAGKRADRRGVGASDGEGEKKTAVTAKTFGEKWLGEAIGGVDEELGFDATDSGRLLEGADGVAEQLDFDFLTAVVGGRGVFNVKISDDTLGAFIDEEAVAVDASALDGTEAGEDSGVGVAENHVRGCAVVPMESASPYGDFLVNDGAEVVG